MISLFIKYLQYEKNNSFHTVVAYKEDILQFQNFVNQQVGICDFSKIDSSLVRQWMISLKKEKYTETSINRKISSLRSFYKFTKKQGLTTNNPLSKINSLKTKKKLPIFFKESEMESVLSDNNIFTRTEFENVRNSLVIELLYNTGIRRSELIEIKDCDFNFFNLTLQVTGKGNKQRLIPFSNILRESLMHYIEIRKTTFNKSSDYFIVNNKGGKSYPNLIYRIVQQNLGKVSSLTKKSPHVIRHTFATSMLNNGAELSAIKEILGHASLAATQVYTHTSFEQLKKIYKQAHPRE